MARHEIQRIKSGTKLLQRLTDNPALPSFVGTLAPRSLKKLIEEVGVEDSGPLIELTSPQQMAAVLDEALWRNTLIGAPETFDPVEFLRWLEVILDVGDEFCAENLKTLGDDLLVLAVSYFLEILDVGKLILDKEKYSADRFFTGSSAEAVELYGPYQVAPRFDDEWDLLHPMLNALHLEEPDFLQALLTRCCLPGSLLETRDSQSAGVDAAYEHMRSREEQGFVTPESAKAFLASAQTTKVALIMDELEYDLDSARYFDLVERARVNAEQDAQSTRRAERTEHAEAQKDDAAQSDFSAEMSELQEIVAEVEGIDDSGPRLLLTGPDDEVDETLFLRQLLAGLASTQPETFARRMAELVYLSNVLMTGSSLNGERFPETESVAAVLAICNLGLDQTAETSLENEAGLIRLFRVGWNLIQTIPCQVANEIKGIVSGIDSTIHARAWIIAEIRREILGPRFLEGVTTRQFEDVHETIHLLSLVVDSEKAVALESLINDVPRLLQPGQPGKHRVEHRSRFIEKLEDFEEIENIVASVERSLREAC